MKRLALAIVTCALFLLPGPAAWGGCHPDSEQVGPVCVDKYEASVWLVPKRGNRDLIEKIQGGRVRLGALTNSQAIARGVVQLGTGEDDYEHAGCADTGNGCENVYAASIPSVIPARFITWFQAQQACMNAGKRLLTNAEWQGAVAGTPDGVPCTVDAAGPGFTGTAGCASRWDVRDMVGNVSEWVADWVQGNNESSWSPTVDPNNLTSGTYGDDLMWGTNPAEFQGGGQNFPAALVRGGDFRGQTGAGVFALFAIDAPSFSFDGVGFRCGR